MEKMNEPKKIIFVDNLTSINEIEHFSNQSYVKIISFDYISHIKLTEKNRELDSKSLEGRCCI